MCTTSAVCKTVITAMLMVKSGMDPHMISRDVGWFGNSLVVRISSWSWNILVESQRWRWRFCGELSSWSWRLIVILSSWSLSFPCSDVQLELDVRCLIV
jgi:hypothetical protein